jgi:hypothetical protein
MKHFKQGEHPNAKVRPGTFTLFSSFTSSDSLAWPLMTGVVIGTPNSLAFTRSYFSFGWSESRITNILTLTHHARGDIRKPQIIETNHSR